MGPSNNAISWKLLIFSIWPIEQEMFIFDQTIDICDELAPPGPAVTLFDAVFHSQFKKYKFEFLIQFLIPVLKLSYQIYIRNLCWFCNYRFSSKACWNSDLFLGSVRSLVFSFLAEQIGVWFWDVCLASYRTQSICGYFSTQLPSSLAS